MRSTLFLANRKLPGGCLVALLAVTALMGRAVESDPPTLNLVVVRVKPDKGDEFEALQKELNLARKKVGAPVRSLAQVVRGDTSEYHILEPMTKWADLEGPGWGVKAMGEVGFARWVARVTKCIRSRTATTYRRVSQWSIPLKEGRSPRLAVVTTRHVAPGRESDYAEWLEETLFPTLREAGVDGIATYRPVLGNSREWVTVTMIDNWSTFDGPNPMIQSVGGEKFLELVAAPGVRKMHFGRETVVVRLRPDLSP